MSGTVWKEDEIADVQQYWVCRRCLQPTGALNDKVKCRFAARRKFDAPGFGHLAATVMGPREAKVLQHFAQRVRDEFFGVLRGADDHWENLARDANPIPGLPGAGDLLTGLVQFTDAAGYGLLRARDLLIFRRVF